MKGLFKKYKVLVLMALSLGILTGFLLYRVFDVSSKIDGFCSFGSMLNFKSYIENLVDRCYNSPVYVKEYEIMKSQFNFNFKRYWGELIPLVYIDNGFNYLLLMNSYEMEKMFLNRIVEDFEEKGEKDKLSEEDLLKLRTLYGGIFYRIYAYEKLGKIREKDKWVKLIDIDSYGCFYERYFRKKLKEGLNEVCGEKKRGKKDLFFLPFEKVKIIFYKFCLRIIGERCENK